MSKIPRNMKRGPMSADEIAAVEDLAAKGWKPGRVAMQLCRHPATINWTFIRLGLKEVRVSARRLRPYRRGKQLVVPFSADEDAFIEALRSQDIKTPEIAERATKRFGHPRNATTILTRLKMLALVDQEAA